MATPRELVAFNGQAYYFDASGSQVVFGTLTPSGETQVGTAAISTIVGAAASGSSLYFVGGASSTGKATQLWVTNGTQAGTRRVEDFSTVSPLSVPLNLTDADGTLFFTLEGADGLEELWQSNGTSQGTSLVKDLGTSALYSGYAGYLTSLEAIGGTVYFTAYDTTHGAELWETNGTSQGTQLVKDINPGPAGSDPQGFVEFDDQLDFAAHDGSSPQQNELWTSNGTAGGTAMVASFSPGITQGSSSLTPGSTDFATLGSELLLPLEDGIHGPELWATDGTSAGTVLLAPVNPRAIAVLGSDAYFIGSRPTSLGLWVTDGTAAGTTEILDLSKYEDPSSFFVTPSLVASGGKLYFTTSDGGGGVDLWTSSGTAAGTSVVKDFTPPSGQSLSNVSIGYLTAFNGELAFLANDGTHGTQLWVSNGTGTGTQMVTDVSSSGQPPSDPTAAGGSLYFFAPDPSTSDEDLWVTNGTVVGTSKVASIPSVTPSGRSNRLCRDHDGPDGRRVPRLLPRAVRIFRIRPGGPERPRSTLDERRHVAGHDGTAGAGERLDVQQPGRLRDARQPAPLPGRRDVRRPARAVEERRHRGGDRADHGHQRHVNRDQRPLLFRQSRRQWNPLLRRERRRPRQRALAEQRDPRGDRARGRHQPRHGLLESRATGLARRPARDRRRRRHPWRAIDGGHPPTRAYTDTHADDTDLDTHAGTAADRFHPGAGRRRGHDHPGQRRIVRQRSRQSGTVR